MRTMMTMTMKLIMKTPHLNNLNLVDAYSQWTYCLILIVIIMSVKNQNASTYLNFVKAAANNKFNLFVLQNNDHIKFLS